MSMTNPSVDISFTFVPSTHEGDPWIPADHGYLLFSALAHVLPWLHDQPLIGMHPLPGRLIGDRRLLLSRRSSLTIRAPVDRIGALLPLVGQILQIGGTAAQVGVPTIHPLRPAPVVRSRLVVIKGMLSADIFLEAIQRQLSDLGVRGGPNLLLRIGDRPLQDGGRGGRDQWVRRTLRVHDRTIVGYALGVDQLTAEESVRLQERGIGGRRHFGCGIFVPYVRG